VARKVEEQLDSLTRLREAPPQEALPALRKALGDRVNLVVAKAARIAAERQLQVLLPDLLQAFSRLFEDAVRRDPQCWGKTALAAALKDLGHSESVPYLRGLQHKQMEPVWGGEADTAENLRGTCLLALVACPDVERGEALRCFVDALTEQAHTIRIEAARALGQMAGDEGALVLRLKARLGDESAEVMGQVFDSILAIEGARALPFVGGFIKHADERGEEAALALGSSRLAEAFDVLRQAWDAARDRQFRAVLLRAISLSRLDTALDWLVKLVREGRLADATAALEALALHAGSEEIREQVKAAADGREPELMAEFQKRFPR
jgi:hypothetical protein